MSSLLDTVIIFVGVQRLISRKPSPVLFRGLQSGVDRRPSYAQKVLIARNSLHHWCVVMKWAAWWLFVQFWQTWRRWRFLCLRRGVVLIRRCRNYLQFCQNLCYCRYCYLLLNYTIACCENDRKVFTILDCITIT